MIRNKVNTMKGNIVPVNVKQMGSVNTGAYVRFTKDVEFFDTATDRVVKYSAIYLQKDDLYITHEQTDNKTRRISYTVECNKPKDFILKTVSDRAILKNYFVGNDYFESFFESAARTKNFSPINKKQTSVVFTDDDSCDGLRIAFCPINFNNVGNMEYNTKLNIIISNRAGTFLPNEIFDYNWVLKLNHSLMNVRTL